MTSDVLKQRILPLRKSSGNGKCVAYVMSRDQRIQGNHALLAAQKHAIAKNLPLAVVFCLLNKSGQRAREHYQFMLDGLREVEKDLAALNIPFMLMIGSPTERLSGLIHHTQPDALYFDFSPLRGPRAVADHIAKLDGGHGVYVVDTHNCIPTWLASNRQEFAAHTFRSKVHRGLEQFLVVPEALKPHPVSWPGIVQSIGKLETQVIGVLNRQIPNKSLVLFMPGESAAQKTLKNFITETLPRYAKLRNDPSANSLSNLSPYLHFGQISSLQIVFALREEALTNGDELHILKSSKMPQTGGGLTILDGINALIEEMVVRKELSDNFCYYQPRYDSLDGAPEWAQETLRDHESDPREHIYTYEQLVSAETHDPAWNACQRQMALTGKMHGYMRMYWAKKVLEWTRTPQDALEYLIRMNDFYSIDGGDPNGYVGILWSIAGVHDRPWTERSVFGKIRYMNYGGLKRKFDITAYEQRWNDRSSEQ